MPSASSAKIEKTPNSEATDFIKQCISLVEKKVRNLEKRKAKLDGYKDLAATKELISDQLVALSKYDQVVEMLEQSKEIHKNVLTIYQEYVKQAKKQAKKEQQERQQHEVQRIKDVLLIQDILNNMGSDEIRQDFLNGLNGAIKLSEKELNQLDELYKLISPDRDPEEGSPSTESHNFNELLVAGAEHIVLLLDGKNKEILGTTYKALKETIMKVHESGYFDQKDEEKEEEEEVEAEIEGTSVKDENIQATETELPQAQTDFTPTEEVSVSPVGQSISEVEASPSPQQVVNTGYYNASNAPTAAVSNSNQVIYSNQSGVPQPGSNMVTSQAALVQQSPLPDVLMQAKGKFNFLQESQVDIQSPHMDPAVVAAHPMVPPQMAYQQVNQSEALLAAHAAATVRTSSSNLIPPVGGATPQADYDPARPIPTQTFTNQNFAAMQNMMTSVPTPAGYAPVSGVNSSTQQQGSVPQLPTTVAAMMMSSQQTRTSGGSGVPDTPPGYQPKQTDGSGGAAGTGGGYNKSQQRNYSRSLGNNQQDPSTTGHYNQSSDENEETGEGMQVSYNRSRGGGGGGGSRGGNKSRGGGSGSSNGYSRGPRGASGGYSNGRGGGGGSNYYGGNRDRSEGFSSSRERDGGYSNNSGNPRRGAPNSRGGPRGGGRVSHSTGNRGGSGGGVYRSQD